ncbi:HAD-IIIC family phosphatase [Burkholderia cepacia]|uniref:HAD-IIIC family phosphatase n=1 Tax=Burkholderia cepacia TaxID=292 RepID=UPI001F230BE0|nr:HAD-IIIC family phosphatase [Burkholderia cepacia]MCE4126283.1 HAD-IIIC family phosphatase [Burkholderia cepacia]
MSNELIGKKDSLLETLAQILGVPEDSINEETTYEDVDRWDSLRQIIIANSLEQIYSIKLNERDMSKITSVKAIRALLETYASKTPSDTEGATLNAPEHARARVHAGTTLAELRVRLGRSLKLDEVHEAAQLIQHSPDRANWDGPTVKIAVVGSLTVDFVAAAISCGVFQEGVLPSVYLAPFGSMVQEVLNPASGLYQAKPDVVVLAPDWRDWVGAVSPTASPQEMEARFDSVVKQFKGLWDQLAANLKCKILQHTFMPPAQALRGLAERKLGRSIAAQVERLNERLIEAGGSKINWIELDQLAEARGRMAVEGSRYYFTSRMPFAPQFLPDYVQYFRAAWRIASAKGKKVLALDLDNTLWGGVIGDDGPEGIKLGAGSAAGEAFAEWGRYIRELAARGVILAICSKNNPKIAEDGLNHPQAVLKREDFAAAQISWDDKATGLRRLATELNVGLDSFVFADDNPFECELIREQLPEVAVVELGQDPAEFINLFESGRWFDLPAYTKEDFSRAEAYQARAVMEAERQSAGDIDSYLRGLNMIGRLYEPGAQELARLAQMEQKTNQFNLTTKRYQEDSIRDFMQDERVIVLAFDLRDRHADHGLVSSLIGSIDGSTLTIDSWLMSCRVFSRTAEEFILNGLLDIARARRVTRIVGLYSPTKKNGVVAELYQRLGFTSTGADGGEWTLELTPAAPIVLKTFISQQDHATAFANQNNDMLGATVPAAAANVAAQSVEPAAPGMPAVKREGLKERFKSLITRSAARELPALIEQAESATRAKNLLEAESLWRQIAERDPANAYAHVNVVQVLRDLQRIDEADEYAEAQMDALPDNAGLAFQHATNAASAQRWSDAYLRWSNALDRFSSFPEPRHGMAQAAWKSGRDAHAEDLLSANMRLFPSFSPSGMLMADILGARKDWKGAASYLETLGGQNPDKAEIGVRHAIAMVNAGEPLAARNIIDRYARQFSSDVVVSDYQNWIASLNGDWPAAYAGAHRLLDNGKGTAQSVSLARQARRHVGQPAAKSLVIYGNCQGAVLDGLVVRMCSLYPDFDIVRILGHIPEEVELLNDERIGNAVVYWEQYDERAEVPIRDQLRKLIPDSALKLVYPSLSLFSLWPLNWPDPRSQPELPRFPHGRYPYDGDVVGQQVAKDGLKGEAAYQCYLELAAKRLGNLESQFDRDVAQLRKRDAASDVKMTDYVLANYRKSPMFYTWGHVSGQAITEIAMQLLELSRDRLGGTREGDANQLYPLHTAISDFWMPIHPSVAKWHKLEYCQDENALFNIYGNWWTFKQFMIKYIEYDTNW